MPPQKTLANDETGVVATCAGSGPGSSSKQSESMLFRGDRNAISEMAWACTVYSMVPYLGILFVAFAIAAGGFGYIAARRSPGIGGERTALACIGVSVILLAIQVLFWWVLYLIPEIGI